MNFEPTGAQQACADTARTFALAHLVAGRAEREQQHQIEAAVIAGLARHGLLGINVPTALGGQQAGAVAYAMALREIAAVDAAVAVTMAVTNMVAETLARFGTPAQARRFVPPLVQGSMFAGAFALSEPGSGSDAAALTTRAVRAGDGWLLNGQKMWITSGDQAGVLVVWARTGEAGAAGISCFLVAQGTPGLSFGKPEEKMGLRASHTVAVAFQDVRLAADAVLGELGQGFKIAMTALDGGRIGIGSQATGIGHAALQLARAHVQQTSQGAPEQGAMFTLADMACALDAAWLLTLRAAVGKERGQRFTREAAMAKVFASESANQVVRQALQLMGEKGYMEQAGVARLFRDCRVTQVYEGTSEIQRLVISREILKNAG